MKNTNYIPVHTLLGIDEEECEKNYISRYMRWCENLSKTKAIPLQNLLANNSIFNYYEYQHKETEHRFISSASKIHGEIDLKSIRNLYAGIMVDLFSAFPSALLEDAKNIKIENPPYASN